MITKEGNSMFNKDMTIGQALAQNEQVAGVLLGFGMHCFSCPMGQAETIEEACEAHGVDLNEMLEVLNRLEKDNADKQ